MWSIDTKDGTLLRSDPEQVIDGPLSVYLISYLRTQESIEITPVGPVIELPPKSEVEQFLAAFHFVRGVLNLKDFTYQQPDGVEEYMRPLGPNAVY